MKGKTQVKHFKNDRGTINVVLTDDFEAECKDSFLQLN